MPPRGAARKGAFFYGMVLATGFIAGGLLTQVSRRFLPPSAVKEFFTTGVTPAFGPLTVDLVILKFAIGPVAVEPTVQNLGVLAAIVANGFWTMEGPARFMATNAFFEHLGLVGGFALIAIVSRQRVTVGA